MAIEHIDDLGREFESGVNLAHSQKQKAAKSLLNNAGIAVGVLIIFAVIVIVTTDIKLASPEEIGKLGVDFFLLLFCSYSMYINCSDSGMRLGLRNEQYLSAVEKFENRKNYIIKTKNQKRMHEFCRYYIQKELENTKMNILAVVGFDYETYLARWLVLTNKQIDELPMLTKTQKDAIKKANAVMPVKLTPEMIMKRGRYGGKRAPLGMDPETKKKINFGFKFASNVIIALFFTAIIIEFMIEPTWELFAAIVLRSLIVILNGFSGYKFGYENIVFDTSNYMSDQTDLMEQAIQYLEGTEDYKNEPKENEIGL